MTEEQFIQRHIPVCRRKLGTNGGAARQRACARALFKEIKKFDLNPAEVNSNQTLLDMTVEQRTKLREEKAKQ